LGLCMLIFTPTWIGGKINAENSHTIDIFCAKGAHYDTNGAAFARTPHWVWYSLR